jgi:hypothetical protein
MSLFFPSLRRVIYETKNRACANNLKVAALAMLMYAEDNNNFWPFRPTSSTGLRPGFPNFTKFQWSRVKNYPNGFPNKDGERAFSMVPLLAPYLNEPKYKYDPNSEPTIMPDGSALGKTLYCPLSNPHGTWGTPERGIVDAGGGNDYDMPYNYYPNGGDWRKTRYNYHIKVGQELDFGMYYSNNWNSVLEDSYLLLSDHIIPVANGGPKNEVRVIHEQAPNSSQYEDGKYYSVFGSFKLNWCYQDGSVTSKEGITMGAPTNWEGMPTKPFKETHVNAYGFILAKP